MDPEWVEAPPRQATHSGGRKGCSNPCTSPVASGRTTYLPDVTLRLVVMSMTFIAAIVMGVSQETRTLRWYSTALRREYLHNYTLKSTGPRMSQLRFFVAANTILCVHAAISLALSVAIKGPSGKTVAMGITVMDLLLVALIFSSIGSGSAMSTILREGSGNLYIKACDIFGNMCRQIDAAIVLSSLSAAALLTLVLLSLIRLHRTDK